MKVLIADDESLVRSTLQKMIAHFGHEVIEATDGAMAWEVVVREHPRVIISDWNMPQLSGPELCAKIRHQYEGEYIYFILVSGAMTGAQNFARAFDHGVDDFLLKPVKAAEINNRLRVAERILGLTKRVQDLETFLPICSYCKRIRREDGAYEQLESYLYKRTRLDFSHGVCPDCMAANFPAGEAK